MGCLSQLGFFLLGVLVATNLKNPGIANILLVGWGVTQWIGIVPLS